MSSSDLIYGLHDRPTPGKAFLAALQHILAAFVAIITPPIIIASTLGLTHQLPYLVAMSLFVSGIASFIQARTFGRVGSGLMSIQGTNFSFVPILISAGFVLKGQGLSEEELLANIFGMTFAGSFIIIFVSFYLDKLKKIITPCVTGIVVTLIGLSLIKIGVTDMAGGFGAEDLGDIRHIGLGLFTLIIVLVFNVMRHPILRVASLVLGMFFGCLMAAVMGELSAPDLSNIDWFVIPMPFRYGIGFDFTLFIPIMVIYLVSVLEAIGDLTATSRASDEPTDGPVYRRRISNGILGDGVNCVIAAILQTFPCTTFSQNNGVITITGIASRYVGMLVGGILVVMGLFPIIGAVFQQLPTPVLGACTTFIFGTIALSGIRILAGVDFQRKQVITVAVSFGIGLGVVFVPEVLKDLSPMLQNVFGTAVSAGGITAMLCSLLLPGKEEAKVKEEDLVTSEDGAS